MAEELTNKNGQWFRGCGCGNKPIDLVQPPRNSKAVFIQANGSLVGPETGITYTVRPNLTSIDIDERDAQRWLNEGTARLPIPGFKGTLTREV
jgi:hypothetical protein